MAWYWWVIILVAISFFSKSSAELITALPSQPSNIPFNQYSGYITTDTIHGRALFYYFVEANVADPLSRPLTLWLNGESNMLYVESPIGVGFSYSNTSEDYINWNDTRTAEKNLRFTLNWLEEFPQYKYSEPLVYQEDDMDMNLIPLVADLLKEGNPIMLYSGDQDTKIPLTQTRIIGNMLAQQLNLTTFTPYAPWYDKKQVGGSAQSFNGLRDGKNMTFLTYATEWGAAHEVHCHPKH